jgi:hypothetical protein
MLITFYALHLPGCRKTYIGSTQNSARERFRMHVGSYHCHKRGVASAGYCSSFAMFDQAIADGKTVEDVEIVVIEQVECTTRQMRLEYEQFWLDAARTDTPGEVFNIDNVDGLDKEKLRANTQRTMAHHKTPHGKAVKNAWGRSRIMMPCGTEVCKAWKTGHIRACEACGAE